MATDVKNDANLSTGLVSYWELEEASGTRVDSHGSNDLTDNNTVTQGTGKQGNCADFEVDNTEYLSITNAAQTGLDRTGDFSFAFWWKPETITQNHGFWTTVNGNNNNYGVRALWNTNNDLILNVRSASGSDNHTLNNNFVPTAGTWYHIVFTFDSSAAQAKAYIDSTAQTTSTLTYSNSTTGDGGARIGGATVSANAWDLDALIDEFGFWSKVLTQTEVNDLYNSGSGIPYEAAAATFVPKIMMF